MTIKLKVEGLSLLQRGLMTVSRKYNKGYQAALEAALLRVLNTATAYCPIDTGYLRSTGFTQITGSGFNTRGYVGFSAEYAMYVHENVHHSFKAPGTSAKYLEKAIERHKKEIPAMIAESMKKANS